MPFHEQWEKLYHHLRMPGISDQEEEPGLLREEYGRTVDFGLSGIP